VKFVKSLATWQHRFYVDSNFLSYPAPLYVVQFRPKSNHFICWMVVVITSPKFQRILCSICAKRKNAYVGTGMTEQTISQWVSVTFCKSGWNPEIRPNFDRSRILAGCVQKAGFMPELESGTALHLTQCHWAADVICFDWHIILDNSCNCCGTPASYWLSRVVASHKFACYCYWVDVVNFDIQSVYSAYWLTWIIAVVTMTTVSTTTCLATMLPCGREDTGHC